MCVWVHVRMSCIKIAADNLKYLSSDTFYLLFETWFLFGLALCHIMQTSWPQRFDHLTISRIIDTCHPT